MKPFYILYCETCENYDILRSSFNEQSAIKGAYDHQSDWKGIDERSGKAGREHLIRLITYVPQRSL